MGLDLKLGDVVRLKKPHPCGNDLWKVLRLGADLGLYCTRCNRRIMIDRAYAARRIKDVISSESQNNNL